MDYPRDTVILHTWARMKLVPNIDTFSMKLETYLRVNNIPYQFDENYEHGPDKNSCIPWIEYNGTRLADTKVIIRYLNGELNTDLNEKLNPEERSKAKDTQKWLEEHTHWVQYHSRWYIYWDDMLVNVFGCPPAINKLIRRPARWYQKKLTTEAGIGCHSDEEVLNMLVDDIRKFSEILGDKKYIMGDQITEVDCTAFAILSQVRWCSPKTCPGHQLLTGGEVQNVIDYMDRIKATYWSDWEEIMKHAKCNTKCFQNSDNSK